MKFRLSSVGARAQSSGIEFARQSSGRTGRFAARRSGQTEFRSALWKRQRHKFRRVVPPSDGDDEVLLSLVHVGHRSAGCARLEVGFPKNGAIRLVVRAKLIAATAGRRTDIHGIAFPEKQ